MRTYIKVFGLDSNYEKDKKLFDVIDQIRMNKIMSRTDDDLKMVNMKSHVKFIQQLELLLKNTSYQKKSDYYKHRDYDKDKKIVNIIK